MTTEYNTKQLQKRGHLSGKGHIGGCPKIMFSGSTRTMCSFKRQVAERM